MTTNIPPTLDYTDKDFDALVARLRNAIPSVFPTWTDFNTANFGNILTEAFAFIGDVLTTYQDNQGNEAFFLTLTQRKNALALARALGYRPAGAIAAQVIATFTIAAPVAGEVVIPAGTVVTTAEVVSAVRFELLSDVTISPGGTSATGTVENSEEQGDTFTSDGTPNQEFNLSKRPYLDESAVVTAGNGVFTEVTSFLSSTPTDQHFTIVVDQNDRATMTFGNGTNGRIPTGTISVDYRTGGGTEGNIEAGKLSKVAGTYSDSFGTPVRVTVTNVSAVSRLGQPRQSTASIKQEAPRSLRVLERAVAREDFEIVAMNYPGVARALITTSNEDPGVAENYGILYLVPTGGGPPTQELKDGVAAQFAKGGPFPSHLTFRVITDNDPSYLVIDLDSVVFFSSSSNAAKVAAAATIRANLASWFAPENPDGTPNTNVGFGFEFKDADGNPAGEIPWGALYNVVLKSAGVRKVDQDSFFLNNTTDDIPILVREFPSLGDVIIRDGDTGLLY